MTRQDRQLSAVAEWSETFGELLNSAFRANMAVLSFGATGWVPDNMTEEDIEDDWEAEVTVSRKGDINIGDEVEFSKTLDSEDVREFAAASGDTNPLHVDESYAEETRFGDRIVHGTLVSGLISAALARLPGTIIYVSQELKFLEPVMLGERVTAVCEVVEELDNGTYRLSTKISGEDGRTVVDGEAIVLSDEPPADDT